MTLQAGIQMSTSRSPETAQRMLRAAYSDVVLRRYIVDWSPVVYDNNHVVGAGTGRDWFETYHSREVGQLSHERLDWYVAFRVQIAEEFPLQWIGCWRCIPSSPGFNRGRREFQSVVRFPPAEAYFRGGGHANGIRAFANLWLLYTRLVELEFRSSLFWTTSEVLHFTGPCMELDASQWIARLAAEYPDEPINTYALEVNVRRYSDVSLMHSPLYTALELAVEQLRPREARREVPTRTRKTRAVQLRPAE